MGSWSELRAWQAGIELQALVYEVTASLPPEEGEAAASMRSLARSIPQRVAEGHSVGTRRAWLRSLSLARTALAELEVESILAFQLGVVDPRQDRQLTLAIRALRRELAVLRAIAAAVTAESVRSPKQGGERPGL